MTASLQSARSPAGGALCLEQRPDRALVARVVLGVFAALVVLAGTAPSAGAVLVYVRPASHEVVVARDDGSAPRVVADGLYARVSPDGRQLVYEPSRGRGELRLTSIHGGRSWLVARNPSAAPGFFPSSGVAWSPNGRYIAVGQSPYGVVVYDVARRRRLFGSRLVSFGGASFSPDSSRLVFESNDIREDNLVVTSVLKVKLRLLVRNADSPVWGRGGLAFTRDGRSAGIVLKTRRSPLLVPFDSSAALFAVGWSRDGRRLLAAKNLPPLRALLIAPATRQVTMLSPIFSTVDALSRDGNTILGVIKGDVVTVTADGAVTVLVHGAVNPSWTR